LRRIEWSGRGGSKADTFRNAFLKNFGSGTTPSAPLRNLKFLAGAATPPDSGGDTRTNKLTILEGEEVRRATQFLQTATLILVAGLILAGCHGGSGEVRYVNKSNPSESLTFNRAKSVKTKLIYTFHGVSTGVYTLKTEKGTNSGSFSGDGERIKLWQDGSKADTVKINSDGSFDFANSTWTPVPEVSQKTLKALASSKEGAAQ
jgi:hypothetical protein